MYSSDMLVFVDETGTDQRNTIRKYGYSIRGKPAKNHVLFARGERISAICNAGLLDVKTVTGTSDGDTFYDFVHTHLLPHLMPFNGQNPNSVVILDNCSIHHTAYITKTIEEVGAIIHFLPPYSPDLNPIEEAFSKVKFKLRTISEDMNYIQELSSG